MAMADVIRIEPHANPDAQATVTDFIDYTEHLPSDVRRSLALIAKLNEAIQSAHNEVDRLTKQWNAGVEANGATADEIALDLRARISYQKNLSSRYAAAALAEALRMNDEITRHQNLINATAIKLDALPLPPSRDPTPQPVQSPQASRNGGRAGEPGAPGPQIKLRIGNNRISSRAVQPQGGAPRSRRKRIIVPGEVLPPPNPNSPTTSDFSEWESPPPPPVRVPPRAERSRNRVDKPPRIRIPKPPRAPRPDAGPKKERAPRPAGVMGTNVHSQVAGISTSNALAKLTPPPPDAARGGEHAPWMRLTEYEMAKLRKRMKKNAIWAPSDTMIRRELNDAGRGPENYRRAKQEAEDTEAPFVDVDDLMNKDSSRELAPGEIHLDVKTKLFNKGMSLNVQKKEKKALLQKQLAEQARLEAELAAKNLGAIGDSFKDLFKRDKPSDTGSEKASEKASDRIVLKTPTTNRKRKRDTSQLSTEEIQLHSQLHSEIILTPPTSKAPPKKKGKATSTAAQTPTTATAPPLSTAASTTQPSGTTTTTIPLALPASSPAKPTSTTSQPPSPASNRKLELRRPSLVLKPPEPPLPSPGPASSRPQSRPASRRASAGPPSEGFGRERLRRKSATPGPTPTTPGPPASTLASRRAKRPAPGPVQSSQEGGNAISVGKRARRPGKGKGLKKHLLGKEGAEGTAGWREDAAVAEEEEIDPNEPRYCVCGDVSYGTMVQCEDPECEKEWFHLECIGLADIPSRRAKWWCPDCSVKPGRKR